MDYARRKRARSFEPVNKGQVILDALRSGQINGDMVALCALIHYGPAEAAISSSVTPYHLRWFDTLIDRGDSSKVVHNLKCWGTRVMFLGMAGLYFPSIKDLEWADIFKTYIEDDSKENRNTLLNHRSSSLTAITYTPMTIEQAFSNIIQIGISASTSRINNYNRRRAINLPDKYVYLRLQRFIVPWALGDT